MLVEPLSPPGPVLTVVEFDEDELWVELVDDELCDDDGLPCADPFCATRHGLLLSMTIVVPPLSPVTIDTLAPPPLVLLVLSAKAAGATHRAALAIRVVAIKARMMALLNGPDL